ncbi:WD40/YVTN/BNR-like repeat-containing protein [Lacrimispora sphenoides]|uniref:Glycosyl hydrolase n=1 Tax=Lacrimispora sphenoides JCM 1415 TaxID=1297793 RepID=A0ABY1C5E2_9FIRM|nr:hypothetical protein [Lacrimispora sphenoides]SET69621.1 hypothetical protein SAMN02745906_1185 [[Clostridium] sphenoides JCM 1415]SUY50554.1 BNR repeat-containing glycosyl hydrolase [Lacrimispora sphenoides]
MQENKGRMSWKAFWLLLINPLTAAVYLVFLQRLYRLCQFGGKRRNIPILAGCMIFFCMMLLIAIIAAIKKGRRTEEQTNIVKETELRKKKKGRWLYRSYMSVLLLFYIGTTLFYGEKIVLSASNFNGKLSWFLYERTHKRTVEIVHDNVFSGGIDNMIADLGQKLQMPEVLYVATSFNLHFKPDGTITSLETYLYGNDDRGNLKTYLINYDGSKSKRATVYLDGSVSEQGKDLKKLQPMVEILKQVDLEEAVQQWGEEEYGIIYYGVRDWGNDSTGINWVDLNEGRPANAETGSNIRGYTVSVFVPGKENEITPIRYLAASEEEEQSDREALSEEKPAAINPDEEFQFLNGDRFRLNVVDAALGSRYYTLEYSDDGGKSWKVVNQDPFLGQAGVAAGIAFINEKLGFFCLSHNGGDEAELYRTDDGGKTTEPVQLPYSVMEKDPNQDSPFDFPQMPYEEDEILKMVIGQGADGGQEVLYHSEDGGISWEFVMEIR